MAMKRILVAIAVLLLFLGLGYGYFNYIGGWIEFRRNRDTPDAYLNHTVARKEQYIKDNANVLKRCQYFIKNHKESFYSKVFYDSTQLSIDTILYSPNFSKVAVFVIAKNPTSRQEIPDERYDWHYDGYCYFGTRQKDSLDIIYLDSGYGSHSKEKVSEWLRTNYFRLFATVKDANGGYKYKYNLNDTRFWNGPLWGKIKDIKQARILFEKEKKEHPENIYEPKP